MKYQFTMTANPYEVSIYNDSPFWSINLQWQLVPLKYQFTMTVPLKYQFTMIASPYEIFIYNNSPYEVWIYNDS